VIAAVDKVVICSWTEPVDVTAVQAVREVTAATTRRVTAAEGITNRK
jgi:hypothetical protein